MADAAATPVDCRWRLGSPGEGERLWLERHVAGAAHLDVDSDLSAPPGPAGRHPLPEPETFASAARRAGIRGDRRVIAYDDASSAGGAARLWWLLRHFGHDDAVVLDGGFEAWVAAGGPVASGPEQPAAGDFRARPREGDTVTAEELLAGLEGAGGEGAPAREGDRASARAGVRAPGRAGVRALSPIDARAGERYRGEVEPFDPVAGHIPGARSVPYGEIAPGGRYLPPDELRRRLRTEGEAVAYCGSGVSATTLVLASEVAGLPVPRLYPGSWSEWAGRGLPVERGEPVDRR